MACTFGVNTDLEDFLLFPTFASFSQAQINQSDRYALDQSDSVIGLRAWADSYGP